MSRLSANALNRLNYALADQGAGIEVANLLQETFPPGASTIGLGTTSANAAVLPAGTSSVYPTTAADGTVGVRINVADQVTGRMINIGNGAQAIMKVYPPTGGSINGLGVDAAFSSASGKGAILYCLNAVANTWLAW